MLDLYEITIFALPALIALLISQLVTIQVYQYQKFNSEAFLGTWRMAQLIPAFIYAYISDRHYRKGALVISHVLGLSIGLLFYFFHLPFGALIAIGLTFNPISVARAALIDNFSRYSSLKLIALTYIVLLFPWIFYSYFNHVSLDLLLFITFALLFINTFLTVFLFKDRKDRAGEDHSLVHLIPKKNRTTVLMIILGFVLSQTTMEMIWSLIRQGTHTNSWMDLTSFGFVLGFIIAILYKKLPHMSLLTLTYTIGIGISFVSTAGQYFDLFDCKTAVFNSMSYYSVIAGIYLPFVTDGVMSLFHARRKAVASAVVELAHLFAILLASTLLTFVIQNLCYMLYFMGGLFLIATIFQRRVEKLVLK